MVKTVTIDLPGALWVEIRLKAIHSSGTTNPSIDKVIEDLVKNYYTSRVKD